MKNAIKLSFFIVLLYSISIFADDGFSTYAGILGSWGINSINYSRWDETARRTDTVNGQNMLIGITGSAYAKYLSGEFSLSASLNYNDEDETSIHHADWCGILKIQYPFNQYFSVYTGLGLYMEMPPATSEYEGGGGTAVLGTAFSFGSGYKIAPDIYARYGYFGLGEESTKLSYGIRIQFIKKVGRL